MKMIIYVHDIKLESRRLCLLLLLLIYNEINEIMKE